MNKTIHAITRLLLAVSAGVLAMMMTLTAADVIMRYVFRRPIAGAFELSEYMMAIIVPLSIAYCAEQKGHVSVDLFFKKFPKFIQKSLDIFISILTLVFTLMVTWENILYVGETYHDHIASSVLLIPVYPFIIPISVGIGFFALVLVRHLLFPNEEGDTK